MDGLIFFMIFWFCWIITTFFYSKINPDRFFFSAWTLVAILISNTFVHINGVLINLTGLWMMITGFLYGAKLPWKHLLYFMLSSFIIMLSTVCFLLFELFDPVWVLIKREWLMAIIISFVTWLLESKKKQRLVILMLGMIQGELLYAIILLKYPFYYPVSSLPFLDALAISIAFIIILNIVESLAEYFDKYFHSTEKERERLS